MNTLDGRTPEDLYDTPLIYDGDDDCYRYSILCSIFGRSGFSGYELQSEDGVDEWEVTSEEMLSLLKNSTVAKVEVNGFWYSPECDGLLEC